MNDSLLAGKQVAVVGGGPVGLMTAVLLQRAGADVTVYERDPDPSARSEGSTLDIHADSGQLALAAAGLVEPFRRLARPTAERFADRHGTVELEELPDEATAFDRPEIDRADLRRLLLDSITPGTVAWGHNFQSLAESGGRFRLRFADQPDAAADLVVGANGGRSRVRPYVTDATPAYTGSFLIGGEVRPTEAAAGLAGLANRGNLMVRAGGVALFAHTHGDGTVDYYVSFRRPADWLTERGVSADRPETVARLLADELPAWADLYHAAFRSTERFQLLPMYRQPLRPDRDVRSPITLAGDAAHVMPPFGGVGVNVGLLDALHLSRNLTGGSFDTVEAAVGDYERAMYRYAHGAQEQTAAAELAIHSDMTTEELLSATRGPGPGEV